MDAIAPRIGVLPIGRKSDKLSCRAVHPGFGLSAMAARVTGRAALQGRTQTGYDPDHVLARGEVGRVGVPVSHLG
ncbi:hypothetical protein ACWEJP_26740, partial [Streptomyces sp. NPDC004749]